MHHINCNKITLVNTKFSTGLLLNYNRKKKIMVYTLKTRKSKPPNNLSNREIPKHYEKGNLLSPPRSPLCLENITIHKTTERERERITSLKSWPPSGEFSCALD